MVVAEGTGFVERDTLHRLRGGLCLLVGAGAFLVCGSAGGGIYVIQPFRGLDSLEWMGNDRIGASMVGIGVDISLYSTAGVYGIVSVADESEAEADEAIDVPYIGVCSRLIELPSGGVADLMRLDDAFASVGVLSVDAGEAE